MERIDDVSVHVNFVDSTCQGIVVNQVPLGVWKRGNHAYCCPLSERAEDSAAGVWRFAHYCLAHAHGEILAGRYRSESRERRRRVNGDFLNPHRRGGMTLDRLLGRFNDSDAGGHKVAQASPKVIESKYYGYAKQNDKP